jgi:hypothetical protein
MVEFKAVFGAKLFPFFFGYLEKEILRFANVTYYRTSVVVIVDSYAHAVAAIVCKPCFYNLAVGGFASCFILASDDSERFFICHAKISFTVKKGRIYPPFSVLFVFNNFVFVCNLATDGKNVFFLGDIMTHHDGEKITEFIENLGMNVVSLSEGVLSDMGGLMFLP